MVYESFIATGYSDPAYGDPELASTGCTPSWNQYNAWPFAEPSTRPLGVMSTAEYGPARPTRCGSVSMTPFRHRTASVPFVPTITPAALIAVGAKGRSVRDQVMPPMKSGSASVGTRSPGRVTEVSQAPSRATPPARAA